ncbi:MAG: hypothetical protein JNK22_15285 [Rhodocyclaceae bacterium]|nr:hypothetical protein [Rhodocyclaceae bacterium]
MRRRRQRPAACLLAGLLAGLAAVAWAPPGRAEVFRCVEGGHAVFQDFPCPEARRPQAAPRPADESRWPYGCYELHPTGSGNGDAAVERFRILADGGRPHLVFQEKGKGKGERFALRPASAAELEAVGGGGRVAFDDGYVIRDFAGEGGRPVGIYRQGKILFGFFSVANGPVSRVDCRGW